jgi:PPK2 family polyphosphate:nucleotide phosphotransferase
VLAHVDALRIRPGEPAGLAGRATRDPAGFDLSRSEATKERLPALREEISHLQRRLNAEGRRSLLLVLQGTDTSGKDGAIRHVMRGVSPSGTRVAAFSAPSSSELAHDYLWRVHAVCPKRGELGIFNRSHYEDVVVVRARQLVGEETWRPRFRHIREFERLLADEGTLVVKCFLHISKEEQRKRLQARLDDPEKRWKFSCDDLDDRNYWDDFQEAYEEALTETATEWAPWYVVPADRKWQRNLIVAQILECSLRAMDPRIPAHDEVADVVLE